MKFKIVATFFVLLPTLAVAEVQPFNMMGSWTSLVETVVQGQGGHRLLPQIKEDEIHFNQMPFTIVIDRQQGRNFAGTVSSKNRIEVILGSIDFDNQSGILTDDDGVYILKLIDKNTFQVCYSQITKPKIAGCFKYIRS